MSNKFKSSANNNGSLSHRSGGERSNSVDLSPTKQSKDQYLINRSQKPTTLNGPIDLFDIRTGLVSNKTYIQQQQDLVNVKVKTMKNN